MLVFRKILRTYLMDGPLCLWNLEGFSLRCKACLKPQWQKQQDNCYRDLQWVPCYYQPAIKCDEDGFKARDFSVDRWINAGCINMWFPGACCKIQVFRLKSLVFRSRDWKKTFFRFEILSFSIQIWISHRKTRFFWSKYQVFRPKTRFIYGNTRFFKNIWLKPTPKLKRSKFLGPFSAHRRWQSK